MYCEREREIERDRLSECGVLLHCHRTQPLCGPEW